MQKSRKKNIQKKSAINSYSYADINYLFDQYSKTKNEKTLQEIMQMLSQIGNDLCINSDISYDQKLKTFNEFLKYEKDTNNFCVDILSRWRDSLSYLKGDAKNDMLELLTIIVDNQELCSHERIYTAVYFYNLGFIHKCYDSFIKLSNDITLDIEHRLEAIKFLFVSDEEKNKKISLECLLNIIENCDKYDCKLRYSAIISYTSKKGIISLLNKQKLNIPYDEDFVFPLQITFFNNQKNEVRYRILSAQHLLQMTVIKEEEKINIIKELFIIATTAVAENKEEKNDNENKENNNSKSLKNSTTENIRADAADVIYRLGTPADKIKARELIINLGLSSDGRRKTIIPKTIYENSQNVHDETIDYHTQTFIEKMVNLSMENENLSKLISSYTLEKANNEISTFMRNNYVISNDDEIKIEDEKIIEKDENITKNENVIEIDKMNMFQRNAVYGSLHRINIDTATFTKHKVTTAEVLIHIWARIHSGEFENNIVKMLEKRTIEELDDTDDSCSSGYVTRLVNILSPVDDTIRISWETQIIANVSGRMNKRIRDCKDDDILVGIASGMMENADEDNRNIYLKFIREQFVDIEIELYKEFVEENHIKNDDFSKYMINVKKEWLSDEKTF